MGKDPFVLGIDIDGVVADYFGGIRYCAAEWLHVNENDLTKNCDYDLKNWGSDKWPGGFLALHKFAVTKRNLFSKLAPIKNAPQVIRKLSEDGFRIRFITYRLCMKWHHATAIKETIDWLEKYDVPYWDICFVKDKTSVDADLYIDDSPSNLNALKKAGKKVVAFRQPWNENVDVPYVTDWINLYFKLKVMKENGAI